MNPVLTEQLLLLPDYLQGHLALTFAALGAGIALSVPLGVIAARSPRIRHPLLAVVSMIQTVPGLAILALVVALLGGQIGFVPAFIALTLYSMLPIMRNTVSGLEGVPSDVVEAARGIGLSPRQRLWKVELPLALPVVVAGIRTAAVWTVGMATLSTLVGASSLGNYIFIGIQTRNLTAVTVGSLAAAGLAIVLDALIGSLQWIAEKRAAGVAMRDLKRSTAFAAALSVLFSLALVLTLRPEPKPDFVVGGKPFTEQYILASLLTEQLEAQGLRVEQNIGMGSDVIFEAIGAGTVDLYVEYSGTIWGSYMRREGNPGRDEINRVTQRFVSEQGLNPLGLAGFQNRYALAMSRERAAQLGVSSVQDLEPLAAMLQAGGDLEFFGRSEWQRLQRLYGLDFAQELTFDAALMYTAVEAGQVDVISAYSTDGRVAAYDLLLLDDPREALLSYDALFLASAAAAEDERVAAAIAPLLGAISDEAMRAANKMVDVDGRPVAEAVAYLRASLN
ncbi:MAG: ABC transporter permease/substrate-binding protein [Gammaproteobacteria bacterium]|jgi:osmoprotectant transport system permease protein|nr:ABC transporter permease/substrate-binding protein [Gammaproteobacteria bacterium]